MKLLIKKFIEIMNTKNVGYWDRALRILVGILLIAIGVHNHASIGITIALVLIGINVAMTGIRGVCSIYYMLGYLTCPISNKPNPKMKEKV